LPTALALRVELLLARAAATVIGDHQRLKELAVSLMPKGYDTLLSPQELSDLVAFLLANR
ncbi:MAG: hypothetical protein WCI09_12260, partial [Planctomycetota bacterium]